MLGLLEDNTAPSTILSTVPIRNTNHRSSASVGEVVVQINLWIGLFVVLLVGDVMGEKKKALREILLSA